MSRGVCLVTGASRGIGAACARLAAERGWDVVVHYRSAAEKAEAVAEEVRRAGRQAATVAGDVATEDGIAAVYRAVDAFTAEVGPLTALVNNAGAAEQVGDVASFTFARVERIIALNLTGAIWVAREAMMRMATSRGGKGGAIVNLSSAAAKLGSPGAFVDYAAAKGGVDTFTVGLALEWARDGVRVNAVRPGIIDTDFQANVGRPDRPKTDGPKQPMGRAGTVDDVARAVLYLLSDEAAYTTGAFLDVSGGRSAIP